MVVVLKPLREHPHPPLQINQSVTFQKSTIFPPIRFWLKLTVDHFEFVS